MAKSKLQLPAEEKETARQWVIDILAVLIGSFLFALAVHVFWVENQMVPGGISGASMIINYLTQGITPGGFPIGTINLLLNIPIMILGFMKLGRNFMIKTLISLAAFAVFQDIVVVPLPAYTENRLLAAIIGGALAGIGIGLMMLRGGSSGGMDIVNKIIQRRLPHMQLGQVVFMTDLVVVVLAVLAYGELEPGLYAVIAIYIQSAALDKVLYGFNTCKFMYIVTEKCQEMSRRINLEMHRGATILESYGSYTNTKKPTVMVAVRQNEYYRIRQIVDSTDPNAFVIVTPATEIMGEGFTRELKKSRK